VSWLEEAHFSHLWIAYYVMWLIWWRPIVCAHFHGWISSLVLMVLTFMRSSPWLLIALGHMGPFSIVMAYSSRLTHHLERVLYIGTVLYVNLALLMAKC
jgi:hypothetical protein